jgi:hypothetical protein
MDDRYKYYHAIDACERKLVGHEEHNGWDSFESYYILYECDDNGVPVREVFCDKMEPEDAILPRDLQSLVDELNRLASKLNK